MIPQRVCGLKAREKKKEKKEAEADAREESIPVAALHQQVCCIRWGAVLDRCCVHTAL
jgi:hypothetical protein